MKKLKKYAIEDLNPADIIAVFIGRIAVGFENQKKCRCSSQQIDNRCREVDGFGSPVAPGNVFHLEVEQFETENNAEHEAEHHRKSVGSQVAHRVVETTDITAAGQGRPDTH